MSHVANMWKYLHVFEELLDKKLFEEFLELVAFILICKESYFASKNICIEYRNWINVKSTL